MEYINLDLELFDYHRESGHETFLVFIAQSVIKKMMPDEAVSVTLESRQREGIIRLKKRGLTKEEIIEQGEILGKMLFPPDSKVRDIYDKCVNGLKDWQRLRIRLTLGNYALSDLPWEYTYILPPDTPEDQKDQRGFLVLNKKISLVRYLAIEQNDVSLDPVGKGNLRMVVIMANPKNDPVYDELEIDNEFDNIKKALEQVKEVIPEPHPDATPETVQGALRTSAHIFHFAGHGEFDDDLGTTFTNSSGKGFIILLDDVGKGVKFSAENLAGFLCGSHVRLAVFTACESGGTDQINAWTGVVPAIIQAGIPAVVGMQFKILDKNAIAFCREFYLSLANGLPIDAAVTEGRLAISCKGEENERDWGVPVLYLQTDKGVLFPAKQDDFTVVKKGLDEVSKSITDDPAVREVLILSKKEIEDVSYQIAEMERFKKIHDALHEIEFNCLQPMVAENPAEGLPVFKYNFDDASQNIQEAIQGYEIDLQLKGLLKRLELLATDFQTAVDNPGDDAFKKVVSDLKALISRVPPHLDSLITQAARKLKLDNLIELLNKVRSTQSRERALLLVPSIEVLPKMRDELKELVSLHSILQDLDVNLRTPCVVAENITGDWATDWLMIKNVCSQLAPKCALKKCLEEKEKTIDDALEMKNEAEAMKRLKGYLILVSNEFRKADSRLKDFCMRLSGLNPTLQAYLNL